MVMVMVMRIMMMMRMDDDYGHRTRVLWQRVGPRPGATAPECSWKAASQTPLHTYVCPVGMRRVHVPAAPHNWA